LLLLKCLTINSSSSLKVKFWPGSESDNMCLYASESKWERGKYQWCRYLEDEVIGQRMWWFWNEFNSLFPGTTMFISMLLWKDTVTHLYTGSYSTFWIVINIQQ
jgi:hypothetical protein